MIELLVGLTVGLMVIAGAIAMLEISRTTSASVSDLGQLQQQGSYALRVIGTQMRQAGSMEPVQSAGNGLYSFTNMPGIGAATSAVSGKDGRNAGTDTVSVSHQPASKASQGRDCLGELITVARTEGTFFVEGNELRCRTAGKNQALVANVADFQVWYRVRSSTDTTQRMTAAQVEAAALWGTVKSIEVCLHLVGSVVHHVASGSLMGCQEQPTARQGRLHLVLRNLFDLRTQGT